MFVPLPLRLQIFKHLITTEFPSSQAPSGGRRHREGHRAARRGHRGGLLRGAPWPVAASGQLLRGAPHVVFSHSGVRLCETPKGNQDSRRLMEASALSAPVLALLFFFSRIRPFFIPSYIGSGVISIFLPDIVFFNNYFQRILFYWAHIIFLATKNKPAHTSAFNSEELTRQFCV